jgi:hypothetical protein
MVERAFGDSLGRSGLKCKEAKKPTVLEELWHI